MEERKDLYRSLCIEAMVEAGYRTYLSPWMQEVVLETADELYEEKLNEARDGKRCNYRLARKWRPSLAV